MNSSQPKVSIVMSSYNHAQYVTEAVESIVNQTYANIEFIVIDDGSKDDTPNVLKALQEKYGFYLECRTNHGLVPTLNYALKNIVTGKYTCILDSDDFWALDKIEKQVAVLEKNPQCGLCHSPIYFVDKESRVLSKYHQDSKKEGDIFEDLLMGKTNIADGGVIIPTKVYEEIGYYDESILIEDYQLWFKILDKYPACYLDEYIAYYRVHDSNVSNDEKKMLKWEEIVINQWKDHPLFKKAKPEIYLRWFTRYAKLDKRKALTLLRAILPYPKVYFRRNFYKGLRRLLLKW